MQYRITPHATTNKSPAEIFLNRKLRTRLDLIILSKQTENIASNPQVGKYFICGERVACKNYTKDSKWKFGTITNRLGKLHYKIALDDGRSWIRHINQMRSIGKNTPIVNDDTKNTDYWEIKGSNDEDENNENIPRAEPVPPRQPKQIEQAQEQIDAPPPPQKDPQPQQMQQTPRRSVREKKRPDYLTQYRLK